jgi:hypothetical protein
MSASAPCLWELIGDLLKADKDLKSRRDKWREQTAKLEKGGRTGQTATDINSQPADDERIWEYLDESVLVVDNDEDIPEEQKKQSEEGLATIVSYTQVTEGTFKLNSPKFITEKGRLHQRAAAEHKHAMQRLADNHWRLPTVM